MGALATTRVPEKAVGAQVQVNTGVMLPCLGNAGEGGKQMYDYIVVGAGSAVVTLVIVALFLDEPEGKMAEILPDGTVQLIDVT